MVWALASEHRQPREKMNTQRPIRRIYLGRCLKLKKPQTVAPILRSVELWRARQEHDPPFRVQLGGPLVRQAHHPESLKGPGCLRSKRSARVEGGPPGPPHRESGVLSVQPFAVGTAWFWLSLRRQKHVPSEPPGPRPDPEPEADPRHGSLRRRRARRFSDHPAGFPRR